MFSIKTILTPLDFSERSTAAAEHSAVMASRFDASLIFLHVIPSSAYEFSAFEGGYYTEGSWPSEEEIHKHLAQWVESIGDGNGVLAGAEKLVRKGDPPKEIETVAAERNVDLIVMPTHGYGVFRRFVLGSVTAKVLHDLSCPVLTGVHVPEIKIYSQSPYSRVACAIDLKEESVATLLWARDFARAWDAELSVIYAAPSLEWQPAEGQYFTAEMRQSLIRAKKAEVESLLEEHHVQAKIYVDCDEVASFVPAAARHARADVLIIGRSHGEGALGRLRTHGYGLVRESTCPVISV
jgi:nucleotide-binding universal stress UspA family protein